MNIVLKSNSYTVLTIDKLCIGGYQVTAPAAFELWSKAEDANKDQGGTSGEKITVVVQSFPAV